MGYVVQPCGVSGVCGTVMRGKWGMWYSHEG